MFRTPRPRRRLGHEHPQAPTLSAALARLDERQRLARELHDSLAQMLYGIALGSQTILSALRDGHDVDAAVRAAEYVVGLAQASLAETRALILELRPEVIERAGLVGALDQLVAALRAQHALELHAALGSEPDLPLATKHDLYRVAQEALNNAVRHAQARCIRVRLEATADGLVLEVRDDGLGFDPHRAYPGHLGLTSMRERVAALGGGLSIDSRPGHGARLRVSLPTTRSRLTAVA